MMWFLLARCTVLAVAINAAIAGQHLDSRVHKAIARRMADTNETSQLEKRGQFSGRWTFFDVGLGACGQYSHRNDFVVALNTPQYGYGSPGPQCFKTITMSYGGKTTTAKIMDECPTCGWGQLDLSRGLFDFFGSEDLGEIDGTWSWGSGGGDNNPPPPPKHTSTKQAPPAYTPPPPPKKTSSSVDEPSPTQRAQVKSTKSKTSTMSKSKKSSTKSASSAKSTSSSVNYNSGPAGGLAVSQGAVQANGTVAAGSLFALNKAFIQLGALVVAGGSQQ